ncbi:MAG: flagellar hook-basal body complex protein FliE [Firmicutes bacterium]|nr:flagellar hook-basal body complex protein FliE [Bacillota bacterium]
MDITSLYNVSSGVIKNALQTGDPTKVNGESSDAFSGFLSAAMDNITQTNAYISDAEDEKIKLAMGETENTHDLTIALQKASAAITYTAAIRDKFLESYRTIMNIQI